MERSSPATDAFLSDLVSGTTNWDQTILPMLPSSMTAVGLRTLRRLGAPPVSMSLMMTINGILILTTSLPCVTSNLN